MALLALQCDDGFSLLEAMIAVLILTVAMMWAMQGLLTINSANSDNQIREEAVRLGRELLVDARSEAYAVLSEDVASPISRQIGSYTIDFTVTETVTVVVTGVSKSVEYLIEWDRKGQTHSYLSRTIVSDQ
jgi:prepilin-type N-terminal cleavage/methylation domain-containing protein